MGFFSKKSPAKPLPNPTIEFVGIRITYNAEHEWWDFTHESVDFISYGPQFKMPSKEHLDQILVEVTSLMPEMKSRLVKRLKEWDDVKIDDGETFTIDLTELDKQGTYEITWSGGSQWGDMGVDFVIQNGKIDDEVWGD
jgi:hypothetical protein